MVLASCIARNIIHCSSQRRCVGFLMLESQYLIAIISQCQLRSPSKYPSCVPALTRTSTNHLHFYRGVGKTFLFGSMPRQDPKGGSESHSAIELDEQPPHNTGIMKDKYAYDSLPESGYIRLFELFPRSDVRKVLMIEDSFQFKRDRGSLNLNFFQFLNGARSYLATDPRDKVYALLGHPWFEQDDGSEFFPIDYS